METLSRNYNLSIDDARTEIEDHVGPNASVNNAQRILLIAENFDPAPLVAAEWLHENYGVDIRCYQIRLSQENGIDYLTCTCIYPPLEIATLSRGSERGMVARAETWIDWPTALKAVANTDVRQFFATELTNNQENRLRYRELIYRIGGKRRYWLACRSDYAYVRQAGRFAGDEVFWNGVISKPTSVGKRHGVSGASLRFHLATAADFAAFKKSLEGDLKKVEFSAEAGEQVADSED